MSFKFDITKAIEVACQFMKREGGSINIMKLRNWCHERCEEWTPLEQGRDRIPLERIARAVGKTDEQIKRLTEEAEELSFLATALSRG